MHGRVKFRLRGREVSLRTIRSAMVLPLADLAPGAGTWIIEWSQAGTGRRGASILSRL